MPVRESAHPLPAWLQSVTQEHRENSRGSRLPYRRPRRTQEHPANRPSIPWPWVRSPMGNASSSFQSCLFQYSVERARRQFLAVVSRDGDHARAGRMLEMTVAALGAHLFSTVSLKHLDHLAHPHWHEVILRPNDRLEPQASSTSFSFWTNIAQPDFVAVNSSSHAASSPKPDCTRRRRAMAPPIASM